MKATDGSLYQFSATLLDGTAISFERFRGMALLIVNTASQCGFTPQYAGLEELHRTYQSRGFAVLGFPCNQFGHQEPGSAADIGAFCEREYGVTFPIFARIDVNGAAEHPLYTYLKKSQHGILGTRRIRWNFTKFLIDRNGLPVRRFAPTTRPLTLASRIEALLDQPRPAALPQADQAR